MPCLASQVPTHHKAQVNQHVRVLRCGLLVLHQIPLHNTSGERTLHGWRLGNGRHNELLGGCVNMTREARSAEDVQTGGMHAAKQQRVLRSGRTHKCEEE